MKYEQRKMKRRLDFAWILDQKRDLIFYIGSALVGWLYVGIIWYASHRFSDTRKGSFSSLRVGDFEIPFTLQLLVVTSWAILLDAPHIWATLGRTLFDIDEWKNRRSQLLGSFGLFLVGPIAISLPYFLAYGTAKHGFYIKKETMAIGAIAFFTFFRLWAYYHVVRQHWGFFALYKRKANDYGTHRLDYWFFNLTMYMPLIMFMTGSFYPGLRGYPNLGLHSPIIGSLSISSILYPFATLLYFFVLVIYLSYQLKLFLIGERLNISKLLYMLLIVPLHFVAFSDLLFAAFITPIVTVGHNIQYHCIVYTYAQNKYQHSSNPKYRVPRSLFKNLTTYVITGIIFTFLCYRGPWINWLKKVTGLGLDKAVFHTVGMMAGISDPTKLKLGQQVTASLISGFALQHYYLDSIIWRVSKDKRVQKYLNV